ncbi:MAG: hypothetical protein IJJ74_02580 [Eubacterium sp.]|nr:hypothetical protein [Eubacterium sp.]
MKKLFGGINMTWLKLVIFAVVAAVYTAVVAIIPITRDTSFRDITISFEVWILFGVIIIMNSKSAVDSALKCFVFFLISQPLIYLIQVPFSHLGWGILGYYKTWFIWTLLTIPMGFVGYYMKMDKWWGLLILTPVLIFLAIYHYYGFFSYMLTYFPYRVISSLFCIVTMIMYPLVIFKDKKIRLAGLAISIVLILGTSGYAFIKGDSSYETVIMATGYTFDDTGLVITFDDSYSVRLKDESYGDVSISYNEDIEDYAIDAKFKKIGKTELIIESPSGEKVEIKIDIKSDSYKLTEKKD